jgi:outer membrane cobalamin receptor
MKRIHVTSAAALVLAGTTFHVRAEDVVDNGVAEVIVTATRSTRALNDVPASASLVTATEVEDTPAQSLDDVLRHVPGVNLPIQTGTEAHPTADNVSMRGLGGIHALVLVDGVPLNDPFFGYIQWGRIPLESIDHVEVVRGGGSPLWGNFAMGGVINVITRAPDKDVTVASAGGGTFGTYRSSLFGSYGLSETNRIGVTAELNGTDGFTAVPSYARRPFDTPTSFNAKNLDLRDTWKAMNDLLVDLRFTYHKNDQQLGASLNTNHQDIYSYAADVKKSFGEAASLTGTVFHTQSTFVTNNPTVDDPSLPLANQTEHIDNIHTTPYHNTGGSLIWSQNFAGPLRNLTAGADLGDIVGSDSGAIFDATGVNQIRTDFGRGEQRFAGVFIQGSIVPIDRLEILASGRLQYLGSWTVTTAIRAAPVTNRTRASRSSILESVLDMPSWVGSRFEVRTTRHFARRRSTICIAALPPMEAFTIRTPSSSLRRSMAARSALTSCEAAYGLSCPTIAPRSAISSRRPLWRSPNCHPDSSTVGSS